MQQHEHAADEYRDHQVVDEFRFDNAVLRPINLSENIYAYFLASAVFLGLIIHQIVEFFVYLEAFEVHVYYAYVYQQSKYNQYSHFHSIFQLRRTDPNRKNLEHNNNSIQKRHLRQRLADPRALIQRKLRFHIDISRIQVENDQENYEYDLADDLY